MEKRKSVSPKVVFPFNPAVTGEMRSLIDRCRFATVKQHCRSERSPIQFAVIVDPVNVLWEIGELMLNDGHFGRNLVKSIEFKRLRRAGSLKIANDKPSPQGADLALDTISDGRECEVIYMPPAYLVRFTKPGASGR